MKTHADLSGAIDEIVDSIVPELIALRRDLHAHPELSWHEEGTQRRLAAWLAQRGISTQPVAGTGLLADAGSGERGVVYRGDIDALPIVDTKADAGVPWASTNPGVCHACGHDVHSTIAAGVAVVASRLSNSLGGRLRTVFQPAEEVVPAGGLAIVESGALDGFDAALAVHVDPTRDAGTIATREGTFTAATDSFVIVVHGKSGHAARPWLGHDAIVAAAEIVRALHVLVPQRIDPLRSAVINVGVLAAGEARNVIADRARIEGGIRCFERNIRETLRAALAETAATAAKLHGCHVEVTLEDGAPPVNNDPRLHQLVRRAAIDALGAGHVGHLDDPSTGAEDFGFYGDKLPICMVRLGARVPGAPVRHLHTPGFDVDERCIDAGVRTMARACVSVLRNHP
jgi:amidohydrolase